MNTTVPDGLVVVEVVVDTVFVVEEEVAVGVVVVWVVVAGGVEGVDVVDDAPPQAVKTTDSRKSTVICKADFLSVIKSIYSPFYTLYILILSL
jgi:hypothetical protein